MGVSVLHFMADTLTKKLDHSIFLGQLLLPGLLLLLPQLQLQTFQHSPLGQPYRLWQVLLKGKSIARLARDYWNYKQKSTMHEMCENPPVL